MKGGIETTLHGLQPNPLEVQLHQMQELARELGSYYYRHFGKRIGVVAQYAWLQTQKKNGQYYEETNRLLSEIEDHYSRIPLSRLQDREEFHPLLGVRLLLPRLREAVDKVFKDGKTASYTNVENTVIAMTVLGHEYFNNLRNLVLRIKSIPEGKDFMIDLPLDLDEILA